MAAVKMRKEAEPADHSCDETDFCCILVVIFMVWLYILIGAVLEPLVWVCFASNGALMMDRHCAGYILV